MFVYILPCIIRKKVLGLQTFKCISKFSRSIHWDLNTNHYLLILKAVMTGFVYIWPRSLSLGFPVLSSLPPFFNGSILKCLDTMNFIFLS